MNIFTLTCLAKGFCPGITRNFVGVASFDDFFWVQDIGQMVDTAAAGSEFFFYQIVNNAAYLEIGRDWLLLVYIVI